MERGRAESVLPIVGVHAGSESFFRQGREAARGSAVQGRGAAFVARDEIGALARLSTSTIAMSPRRAARNTAVCSKALRASSLAPALIRARTIAVALGCVQVAANVSAVCSLFPMRRSSFAPDATAFLVAATSPRAIAS